jgi:hypothetical protein
VALENGQSGYSWLEPAGVDFSKLHTSQSEMQAQQVTANKVKERATRVKGEFKKALPLFFGIQTAVKYR